MLWKVEDSDFENKVVFQILQIIRWNNNVQRARIISRMLKKTPMVNAWISIENENHTDFDEEIKLNLRSNILHPTSGNSQHEWQVDDVLTGCT